MTERKYELDRRYPFKATADSVLPPEIEGATVTVWGEKCSPGETLAASCVWDNSLSSRITHFMVTKYQPEKHKLCVNVYDHCSSTFHVSKEAADKYAKKSKHRRTACAPFEWEDGQGL